MFEWLFGKSAKRKAEEDRQRRLNEKRASLLTRRPYAGASYGNRPASTHVDDSYYQQSMLMQALAMQNAYDYKTGMVGSADPGQLAQREGDYGTRDHTTFKTGGGFGGEANDFHTGGGFGGNTTSHVGGSFDSPSISSSSSYDSGSSSSSSDSGSSSSSSDGGGGGGGSD